MCYHYEKPCHLKKDCYLLKKQQSSQSQEAHFTKVSEALEDPELLNVINSNDMGKWILDSSCTYHMCSHILVY